MKNSKSLVFIVLVALCLVGCEQPKTTIDSTLLFGLWQEQEDAKFDGEYMRFLTASEEAKEGDYFFGREWDQGDGVYEIDLKYKGNGWFKWKVDGTTLTKIELMDNGSAQIPKTYTIKTLNSTQLQLQDPQDKKDIDTWIRQK